MPASGDRSRSGHPYDDALEERTAGRLESSIASVLQLPGALENRHDFLPVDPQVDVELLRRLGGLIEGPVHQVGEGLH